MKQMKEFTLEQITEANLDCIPLNKQLLINYVGYMYEDNADYSNDSLKREWLYLWKNGRIEELLTAEMVFTSIPNLPKEA